MKYSIPLASASTTPISSENLPNSTSSRVLAFGSVHGDSAFVGVAVVGVAVVGGVVDAADVDRIASLGMDAPA